MTLSSAAACAGAQQEVERLLVAREPVVLRLECADLTAVEVVARMRVLAHRYGGSLTVVGNRSLICLCGLDEVL